MEQNMTFAVDRITESLQANKTNPTIVSGSPLHYSAEGRAKLFETVRRDSNRDREAADGLPTDSPLGYLASSLAQLLEAARYELEWDHEAAKASLVTAWTILQYEIERHSGVKHAGLGGLTG
jgi:hypothetical protein